MVERDNSPTDMMLSIALKPSNAKVSRNGFEDHSHGPSDSLGYSRSVTSRSSLPLIKLTERQKCVGSTLNPETHSSRLMTTADLASSCLIAIHCRPSGPL